jgi:hypothetical protein
MKRKEILALRSKALLSLKAFFVATLDSRTLAMVQPVQIQAAAALHQALCWEWEDSWNGFDTEGLVFHLQGVIEQLTQAMDTKDAEAQSRHINTARFTLANLIDNIQEEEPEDDDDDEEAA